jgi:hypothetical protein
MNEQNNERLRKILQSALPPLEAPELKQDLWPRMLRRLDERPIQASWVDWILMALVVVWLFAFPEAITGLLYHL